MLCFADDDTRVKLKVVGDDPHLDYINANHVPVSFCGEPIKKCFLAFMITLLTLQPGFI